jgi:isopentenyldiphosphate isomerase
MAFPTPEERFDVVDAEDRVIATERRSVVHAKGLPHRAVHILLQNGTGEVLLQRRAPEKDMHPDCWDSSCSGHLNAGEDYDPAAARELAEELGIAPPPLARVLKISACPPTGQEFVWVYRGNHEGPFTPDPKEISAVRFVSPDLLDREIAATPEAFSPAFTYIWESVAEAFRIKNRASDSPS